MNLAKELYDEVEDPNDGPEARRQAARRQIQIPLDIDINGRVSSFLAETRDVTPESIGITCAIEIPIRTVVKVRRCGDGEWTKATVVHCEGSVSGYKIGLEIIGS